MSKPAGEFWVTMEFPGPHFSCEGGKGAFKVREVREIDWQALWVDYDEWQMDYKGKVPWNEMTEKIKELVEKQLAGETG